MEDKDKIIAELKAENAEIKISYINFIAKLKREMITKDDIQDLKDTAKRFVEERNSLRKENAELKAENERLKEEKSKLLSKCIDKQCRINELINIVSTKEFTLKVNGKKYEGLNGIDKAKLFINNENAVRDKYNQTLQEIKKYIAKICKEDCGHVQKKRCPDCDCRYGAILDLITEAESEG